MKSQVLHTVWCHISGEAAGEIWSWPLLGVKGLNIYLLFTFKITWDSNTGCVTLKGHSRTPSQLRFFLILCIQIERDKLLKEQMAREEAVHEKEEVERRMLEMQEEASRTKEALVRKWLPQLNICALYNVYTSHTSSYQCTLYTGMNSCDWSCTMYQCTQLQNCKASGVWLIGISGYC